MRNSIGVSFATYYIDDICRDHVRAVCYIPHARKLLSSGDDKKLVVWNLESPKKEVGERHDEKYCWFSDYFLDSCLGGKRHLREMQCCLFLERQGNVAKEETTVE